MDFSGSSELRRLREDEDLVSESEMYRRRDANLVHLTKDRFDVMARHIRINNLLHLLTLVGLIVMCYYLNKRSDRMEHELLTTSRQGRRIMTNFERTRAIELLGKVVESWNATAPEAAEMVADATQLMRVLSAEDGSMMTGMADSLGQLASYTRQGLPKFTVTFAVVE